MAATKKTAAPKTAEQPDVIARLADKGEESLRWLVGTPRRLAVDVRDGVEQHLHDLVGRLRSIDPLDSRVADLERRLGALEKPARKPARTSSTRVKRAAPARATPTRADQDDTPAGGDAAPDR